MAALITISEANAALNDELFPEWDSLEDEQKALYISQASAYVQLSWEGPEADYDFSWSDDTTWDDEAEIKSLVAQYSDAVRGGIIYSSGSPGDLSLSPIKSKRIKAGPVETTTEYAQPETAAAKKSVRPLDDQMLILGFTPINSLTTLLRV